MDFEPSDEQKEIITSIGNDKNIIGDCVAGSGKTTTILFLAKQFPKKRILQITYNSQLKLEVREKVNNLSLQNIEIHTYHSLVVKYYDLNGKDDAVIRRVVEQDRPPRTKIPKFDIEVLDETQDMKDLFYNLIKKFNRDMKNEPSLLILGDRYQAVYKFMGADPRFLTIANDIWPNKVFENKLLSTSYRVTNEIAAFVNDVMLGYQRIKANRPGSSIIYMRENPFTVYTKISVYLINLIKSGIIKPSDIFVLAGSISGESSPIRKLENELVKNNIPCYYPTSDERKLDDEIIQGKVIFSTFHQAKGRERKIVIVYGFDSGYFKYFGKDYDPLVCPETLYVACTRAKEKLILIEGNGDDSRPLPFLKMNHSQIESLPYIDFSGKSLGTYNPSNTKKENNILSNLHKTTPSELVKFLKEHIIQGLIPLTEMLYTTETGGYYTVDIPSKISTGNDLYEEVSDINGIVIPSMYESRNKESTIQKWTKDKFLMMSQTKTHEFLQDGFIKYMNKKCETVNEYLYLGTLYISMNEELYHKMKQITKFDWITEDNVKKCWEPLNRYLPPEETMYEEEISHITDKYQEYGSIEINGRFDAVTDDTIWELKCVENITIEHKLQVIIYAWLYREEYYKKLGSKKFKLLNMRTGEVCVLNTSSHLIDEVMQLLFENKYRISPPLSDEEFIEKCHKGIIGSCDKKVETLMECLFLDD